jgi:hypothetical protein
MIFYQLSSGKLTLAGLRSAGWENSATVSATLFDPNGNAVSTFEDVVGTYVPGSNGSYVFIIPGSFNPPAAAGYVLVITCSTPDGSQMTWRTPNCVVTPAT